MRKPAQRGIAKSLLKAVSANYQDGLSLATAAGLTITPTQANNALSYLAAQGRLERERINGTLHYRLLRAPPSAPVERKHRMSKHSLAAVIDMNGDIVLGKNGASLHLTPEEAKRLVQFFTKLGRL